MDNGIVKIRIENFKAIKHLEEVLNGNSCFLIGDNEVGKTTFLHAIFSTLANKDLPPEPITKGRKNGSIEIDFKIDGKLYTAKRKFTQSNPRGYFEIESEDGFKNGKLSFLDELVGDISFDPFEFVNLGSSVPGRRKQAEILRSFLTADENEQINIIDHLVEIQEAKASEFRKQVADLRPVLQNYEHELEGEVIPGEKENINELSTRLNDMRDSNRKYDELSGDIAVHQERIETLKAELAALETRIQVDQGILKKTKVYPPDQIERLVDRINKAEHSNMLYETDQARENVQNRLIKAEDQLEMHVHERNQLAKDKQAVIEHSSLPVKELSFDEEGVTFKGLPLSESQVATSQIMDIGVRLAVAKNPRLKILKIPRGESLGSGRLEEIKQFIRDNGYQVFIEKVDPSKSKLTVQLFD